MNSFLPTPPFTSSVIFVIEQSCINKTSNGRKQKKLPPHICQRVAMHKVLASMLDFDVH